MKTYTQQKSIMTFQACHKAISPADSHSKPEPYVKHSYPRSHCRYIVSHIDFLVSTHYFNELSPQDKVESPV